MKRSEIETTRANKLSPFTQHPIAREALLTILGIALMISTVAGAEKFVENVTETMGENVATFIEEGGFFAEG